MVEREYPSWQPGTWGPRRCLGMTRGWDPTISVYGRSRRHPLRIVVLWHVLAGCASSTARVAGPANVLVQEGRGVAGEPAGATRGTGIQQLSIAASHECAVVGAGRVLCRGLNDYGQLGSVENVSPSLVARVAAVDRVRDVFTNDFGTVAVRDDGTVWAWGGADSGVLGPDPVTDRCRDRPCVRRPRGIPGVSNVEAVVGNTYGMCALTHDDRSVWCWGRTVGLAADRSDTPRRIDGLGDVRDLIVQGELFMARRVDGSVAIRQGADIVPTHIPPAWRIAPGAASHVCAWTPEGAAWCWGDNRDGQVGVGETSLEVREPRRLELDGVRSIARTDAHACAVRTDGSVWCWGANAAGQCGADPNENEECPRRPAQRRCVVRPRRVDGVTRVERVFVGSSTTCALRDDGSLWCWGARQGYAARPDAGWSVDGMRWP